jgi:hypothetical protein
LCAHFLDAIRISIQYMRQSISSSEHKKTFYLTATGLKHLERHFGNETLVGSHFLRSTFSTPDELLAFVNSTEPAQVIEQSFGKTAFCFELNDGRMAGTSGLAARKDIPENSIVRETREGYTMEIGFVSELTLTNAFCVIAQKTSQGLSIITAFPGGYARPFAQKGQPAEEYALNKLFWEENVLLKQKTNAL